MKSIILPCTPIECEKIAKGDMSILVRKKVPKETPFKAYIYCTWGNPKENYALGKKGKGIGEFTCDKVEKYEPHVILSAHYEVNGAYVEEKLRYNKGTSLSYEDMVKKSNSKTLRGLCISNLKIYDEPKDLNEFMKPCVYVSWKCDGCGLAECGEGYFVCGNRVTQAPREYVYVRNLEK